MKQESRVNTVQYIILIILWSLIYLVPLQFGNELDRNWYSIQTIWLECTIILLAFLINRFILMPYLFFKKKYCLYVIFIILILFAIYFLTQYVNRNNNDVVELIRDAPRPRMHPPGKGPGVAMGGPGKSHLGPQINRYINTTALSFLILCFDVGLNISMKWLLLKKREADLKNENTNVKLTLLQSQVSPHFLMNTLNNIHALVEINPTKAQETIIELSQMMDYLLHETANSKCVPIYKELGFIESYVNLMRIRYPKRVIIEFSYNDYSGNNTIPPLLSLNFIENAFKYGVNYSKESFIKINFTFNDSGFETDIINTNHATISNKDSRGLGINNSKNRLKLIYGDNYNLAIESKQDIFHVNLKVPFI